MKKIRQRIKILVLGILFLGILTGIMVRTSYVLREKEGTAMHDLFRQFERDSIDTIFVGTSHQYCSINPDILYEEYGINSFMMATSGQTVPMTYYAVMEAIEYQHPKTIIMEALYCANDFRTVTPGMTHMFFDGMPWCEAKHLGVKDLAEPEERLYYYFDLGFYHSRWKDLSEVDFQSNLTSPRGTFFSDQVQYNWEIPVLDKSEKEPMPEEMKKYLDKIIALCKENEVELILYVAPYNALYDDDNARQNLFYMQRVFHWLEEYVEEQVIPFHNLFHELDSIGLDGATDFMDSQHCNYAGQEKLTRYMVEKGYIK